MFFKKATSAALPSFLIVGSVAAQANTVTSSAPAYSFAATSPSLSVAPVASIARSILPSNWRSISATKATKFKLDTERWNKVNNDRFLT